MVAFIAFVFAEKYAKLPVAPLNLFVQWKWRNVPIMLGERFVRAIHLYELTIIFSDAVPSILPPIRNGSCQTFLANTFTNFPM